MNNTQNHKINQVSEETLVVGIDIGSETHYARAFDWRGIEYSKKPLKFNNDEAGFEMFVEWAKAIAEDHGKTKILPGMEPTGHYWFNLGFYLLETCGIKPVLVNPFHVKRSKELDDNSPTKNDRKDPKVIAGLVKDGRYQYPYIPKGVYAELRTLSNLRFQVQSELVRLKNRITRWLSIYFPEYKNVYGNIDAKSGFMILKNTPLPCDIIKLGTGGVNKIWRDAKVRAVGIKRAETLLNAAEHSVGSTSGLESARIEIRMYMEKYDENQRYLDEVMDKLEELSQSIPEVEVLMQIPGIGAKTVTGFLAEVGDIRRFNNPKQVQKYAGLALKENSSGKHKGETTITRRGRKRLRYILFNAAKVLVAKNLEFRELHRYYTTRTINPLKKMQSLMAIANKLIRVFYAILTTGIIYDGQKMLKDIKRPKEYQLAA